MQSSFILVCLLAVVVIATSNKVPAPAAVKVVPQSNSEYSIVDVPHQQFLIPAQPAPPAKVEKVVVPKPVAAVAPAKPCNEVVKPVKVLPKPLPLPCGCNRPVCQPCLKKIDLNIFKHIQLPRIRLPVLPVVRQNPCCKPIVLQKEPICPCHLG